MKYTLYTALRALITMVIIAAPSTAVFATGGTSLANTSWAGTVTFVSGANNGVVEYGNFQYHSGNVLTETTNGPVGDYTGTGTWVQGNGAVKPCMQLFSAAFATTKTQSSANNLPDHLLFDHFVEPIAGTNLEVVVDECGVIAFNNASYVGYGHGQLYSVTDGQPTPVPGSSGTTVSRMTRQ